MRAWRSWAIRIGSHRGSVSVVALLLTEVAEIDIELGLADDARVDRALDVGWEGDSVPQFIIPHKGDLLQKYRGSFDQLAGFPDPHPSIGVNPQLAFK